MSAERRQSARFTVAIASTVITTSGQTYPCEILDISETGCRIELKEQVQLWGAVRLSTKGEETFARVIWSEGRSAGLWFPNVVETVAEPEPGLLKRMWSQLRGTAKVNVG